MISPQYVSACFITKDRNYPEPILASIMPIGFGEVMILTNCDSPHRKQELFAKAKYDYIYYQDDDCIAPIWPLFEVSKPNIINCAMKATHLKAYADSRIALLGWGSLFPKEVTDILSYYRREYGEDEVYCRETERIMTWLNFPQHRLDLPISDLPSATAPDRLHKQESHYSFIPIVEARCCAIWAKYFQ
jgi:hypothetical protein